MKGFIRKVACLVLAFTMIMSVNAFAIGPAGVKDCIKDKDKAIILVGDSRVMHMALNGNVSHKKNYYFVYGNGFGIQHLASNTSNMLTNLKNAAGKYKKAKIVLMLGVNFNSADTEDARLKQYDKIINSIGKSRFVVSTVGKTITKTVTKYKTVTKKVTTGKGKKKKTKTVKTQVPYTVTSGAEGNYKNSRVCSLNAKIRKHYASKGIPVYDLYAYLDGQVTSLKHTRNNDGIHYADGIYSNILSHLRKSLGR